MDGEKILEEADEGNKNADAQDQQSPSSDSQKQPRGTPADDDKREDADFKGSNADVVQEQPKKKERRKVVVRPGPEQRRPVGLQHLVGVRLRRLGVKREYPGCTRRAGRRLEGEEPGESG